MFKGDLKPGPVFVVPPNSPPLKYCVAEYTLLLIFTTFIPTWFTLRNPDWLIAFFVLTGIVYGCVVQLAANLRVWEKSLAQLPDWQWWFRLYYLLERLTERLAVILSLSVALVAAKLVNVIFIDTANIFAFAMFALLVCLFGDFMAVRGM